MIRSLILSLCAASLFACAPMAAGPPTVASTSPPIATPVAVAVGGKVQLEGKRVLILASNAYQAAGAVVVPLIQSDRLTAGQVDRVEALNKTVVRLLSGADKGLSLAERAAGVFSIAEELYRIAGR